MQIKDYDIKTPLEIKNANQEKLEQLEKEKVTLDK